ENSSSRACSKRVGVDILRGSERFLVMRGELLSALGTGNAGTREAARVARAADQSAPQCNRALCVTQRPTTAAGGGIIMDGEVGGTYDTPESAEGRRIVDEAERRARDAAAGFDEDEDDEPWRRAGDE